jgi:dTDP-4-dehydrorhamnose 3,5-epimerase
MRLMPVGLPGLALVEHRRFEDERGWFTESFNQRNFKAGLVEAGLPPAPPFVQDNHSSSSAGVLRGLHYQTPPHAQGKLVRVLRGAIFDVVVDIREGSGTFGKWFGIKLSAEQPRQLWIPAGFAHGFLAMEAAEVMYKTTDYYAPAHERSILWSDPAIGIEWPLGIQSIVSAKDRAALPLADLFSTGS